MILPIFNEYFLDGDFLNLLKKQDSKISQEIKIYEINEEIKKMDLIWKKIIKIIYEN